MLSEDQVYNGKVFIRSYYDALICLKQVANKQKTFVQFAQYYQTAKSTDETIDLESRQEAKSIFRFSKNFLVKYFKPDPKSFEEVMECFKQIKEDLQEIEK